MRKLSARSRLFVFVLLSAAVAASTLMVCYVWRGGLPGHTTTDKDVESAPGEDEALQLPYPELNPEEEQRQTAERVRLLKQQRKSEQSLIASLRLLSPRKPGKASPLLNLTAPEEDVWHVAISPDGTTLAAASTYVIALWDLRTGQQKHTLRGHTGDIRGLVFAPDGGALASCSNDGTVRLWDVKRGALKWTLTGHTDWVGGVAFSLGGETLYSGASDGVRVWNVTNGESAGSLSLRPEHIAGLARSPDGQLLAILSLSDARVTLWDLRRNRRWRSLRCGQLGKALGFSPDGRRLTTLTMGVGPSEFKVWEIRTGSTGSGSQGKPQAENTFTLSPDGTLLASDDWDEDQGGILRLWDAKSGKELGAIPGVQKDATVAMAFSPGGLLLVTGAIHDKTIRVWSVSELLESSE